MFLKPMPFPPPIYCVPPVMQASMQVVSQITQAPQALILSTHLGALAIAQQHGLKVMRPGGHLSNTSLLIGDIAASGERKSAVHGLVLKAIYEFSRKEKERIAPLLQQFEAELIEWKGERKELQRLKAEARRAGKPFEDFDLQIEELLLQKPVRPKAFRMILQDVTQEGVSQRLSEDYATLAVVSPEGGVLWESLLFKNLATINSWWSGEDIEIVRATKETIFVKDPKFSILVASQWEALEKFLSDKGDIAHKNGFTSRFLFAESGPMQGFRTITGEEVPRDALIKFHDRIAEVMKEIHVPIGADSEADPYIAKFEQAAGYVWTNYYNDVEVQLRPGGALCDVPAAAAKSAEIAARIAALFQYFEHGPSEINVLNAQRGIDLARWYLLEHQRLFGRHPEMAEEELDAMVVDEWLRERCIRYGGCPSFPRNDLLKFGPHRLRNRNRREAALKVLARGNRLRIEVHNKTFYVVLNPAFYPVNSGWGLPPPGYAGI